MPAGFARSARLRPLRFRRLATPGHDLAFQLAEALPGDRIASRKIPAVSLLVRGHVGI